MNPQNQLSTQDLQQIRTALPYGWRQQILELHPGLTARQVSETFYLRTRNVDTTGRVFTCIAKMLDDLGLFDLATKCRNRIDFCKAAQLTTAAA
jgi:hypothetical protein